MLTTITVNAESCLSGEAAKDLFNVIKMQKKSGVSRFSKNDELSFKRSILSSNRTVFSFEQDAICEDLNADGSFTLHFIGKKIGSGGYSNVNLIEKSLKITSTNVISWQSDLPKVVKIQDHCACKTQTDSCGMNHHSKALLNNEFEISSKIDYLGVQQPFFHKKNQSFLIMSEIMGKKLSTILEEDRKQINILSLQQRMAIHLALLNAFNALKDKNILHLDVTPKNVILIDLDKSVTARPIDFGLSSMIFYPPDEVSSTQSSGDINYISPEAYLHSDNNLHIYSSKTVLYSIARILAELWGGHNSDYFELQVGDEFASFVTKPPANTTLKTLFRTLPFQDQRTLEFSHLNIKINDHLLRMLSRNQKERPTFIDVIKEFDSIIDEFIVNLPNDYKPEPTKVVRLLNQRFPIDDISSWIVCENGKTISYQSSYSSVYIDLTNLANYSAAIKKTNHYNQKIESIFPGLTLRTNQHKAGNIFYFDFESFTATHYLSLIKQNDTDLLTRSEPSKRLSTNVYMPTFSTDPCSQTFFKTIAVTANPYPTSSDAERFLDPADKPRDVGDIDRGEALLRKNPIRNPFESKNWAGIPSTFV